MNFLSQAATLDKVPEGARLAADVRDPEGRVLLVRGTELSAGALASLHGRGVRQVQILREASAEEMSARREAVVQRLAHLFRDTQDDPLMVRLHDAVLAYRMEQLQ